MLQAIDTTTGATVAKLVGNGAGDFKLTIEKIELYLMVYEGAAAPQVPIYYDYRNVIATYDNLTTSLDQQHTFNIAPNVYRMTLALQKTGVATTRNNVTHFKCLEAGTQEEYLLKSYQMTIVQRTYPHLAPDLTLTGDSLKGAYKAWKDSATALMVADEPIETFNEWLYSPYYTLTLPRDVTEVASTAYINIKTAADAHNCSLFLFSETTSILSINCATNEVSIVEASNEPA